MAKPKFTRLIITLAASLCGAVLLTGCGGGVELNGAIFDAMGVSSTTNAKREPKMANRTGLIVPPSTASLPPPGSGPATQPQTSAAWPNDPDQKKIANAAAQRRTHDEFCKKATLRAKVERPTHDADPVMGPLGRCDGSILNLFSTNTGGSQ